MSRVRYTSAAWTDLTDIMEYIAADNFSAADRWVEKIEHVANDSLRTLKWDNCALSLVTKFARFQLVALLSSIASLTIQSRSLELFPGTKILLVSRLLANTEKMLIGADKQIALRRGDGGLAGFSQHVAGDFFVFVAGLDDDRLTVEF